MDVGQLVLTMTFADFSNEVQNFLYLSREFDASHVGEGEEPLLSRNTTTFTVSIITDVELF